MCLSALLEVGLYITQHLGTGAVNTHADFSAEGFRGVTLVPITVNAKINSLSTVEITLFKKSHDR